MNILKEIIKKAKQVDATIVLPEAHLDERVKLAAEIILKKKNQIQKNIYPNIQKLRKLVFNKLIWIFIRNPNPNTKI